MKYYHIYLSIIWIIIGIKWGSYKQLKKYYPTILFIGIGDLIYNFFVKDNFLWKFESLIFSHTFIDFFWILTIFPSFIMLYLSYFPKGIKKQIIYISLWVSGFSIIEYITHLLGSMSYHNGWKDWHSPISWILIFSVIKIHDKNFILAWIIYLIIAFTTLAIFDLPYRIFQ